MRKSKAESIADQRPMQDDGSVKRGEMAYADWVKAGMITLPLPTQVIEDEGLTLRNYGSRWRFVRCGVYDR